ncbi:DUF2993 domain-containing protein [Lusitaniella coriacea LEGE 07157]|uniref:DUF2993 domain-containing protein n=1 Tax=Lusitaniella coriacea LEGE 07157 TaxID=945747 RepID=A0A8J7DY29_9CYAN|nr:DUF2993 domain-containing protein [Lusitaniella coriacea]MBE9117338.1 DUF2993 domain-containing protein [Lusitaniella coriacea LEGE 07157]
MLLLKKRGIGEQALNKIAQMAINSQFNQAQRLNVRVKTDPNLLAQGHLESLLIDGAGLVMQNNLRLQAMNITMGRVSVSPLKALMGNIQLLEPSHGKACFVFSNADLTHAFQAQTTHRLRDEFRLSLGSQAVTMTHHNVTCRILASGKIAIHGEVRVKETKETHPIGICATPKMLPGKLGVFFDGVQSLRGREIAPELTQWVLKKITAIANLENFELPGLSLQINQFEAAEGTLTLQATTKMTKLPA